MRHVGLFLLAMLLAPSAGAASQVHVTYLGNAYAVTFVANSTSPVVTWSGGNTTATRVDEPRGDNDNIHRAILPARALTYRVEGRSFSLPAPPGPNDTTLIAVVADVGTDANARAIVAAIKRAAPSLVIVNGDLSYANGEASVWNTWFKLVEPLAANTPMMPTYGNHEDYCPGPTGALRSCGPDANGWRAHFALPNGDELYYSFDWGPMRIVALDTEAFEQGRAPDERDAQESFLDERLEMRDDRWNVVAFHRPLRTTSAKDGLGDERARDSLAPLLDGRADVVLQGHVHAYERAKRNANGTYYVTSGGGGRSLYDEWGPMEPWVAKRAPEYHFLLINASPGLLRVDAVRVNGSVLDTFTLERPQPPSPTPSPTPPTATRASTPSPTPIATRQLSPNESVDEPRETSAIPLALTALTIALVAARRRSRA